MKILLSTVAVLTAFGMAHAEKLRIAYSAAPVTVDSYRSSTTPSGSLNSHIYEGLLARTNENLLGTQFTWETPTRLVIHLRQGVKFHNGDDFDSHDVVYSACRMVYRVNGKKNILSSSMSPVTNVEAIGPYKVVFETVKPYPILVQKLKYLHIMPASLGTGVPENITFDPEGNCGIEQYATTADIESAKAGIGTGPFKLVSFTKNGTTKMVRNDNYWGKKSDWTELEISAVTNSGARIAGLLSGDYDVVESPSLEDMAALDKKQGFNYITTPSWRTIFILMDVGSEQAIGVTAPDGKNPFADIRVRKAMSLAIDRNAIVNRLLGGGATVAKQFAPEYMDGAETGLPALQYDPEQAKKLLADAGYPDGFSMDFYLPSDRYPNIGRLAQVVAQYWSRVGLTITLKPQPWSVFSKTRKARKLGVWLYGWGHPQGFTQMISFNYPSKNAELNLGSSNQSNYHNPQVDMWMQKWAVETDTEKANTYGREAMKVIMGDMAGIPLYYQHSAWAFRDGLHVKGRPDEFTSAKSVSKK